MDNGLVTPSAADKNQSRALIQKYLSQADGGQISFMEKSALCSGLLAGDHWKVVPQSTGPMNGAQPIEAMKMMKSGVVKSK